MYFDNMINISIMISVNPNPIFDFFFSPNTGPGFTFYISQRGTLVLKIWQLMETHGSSSQLMITHGNSWHLMAPYGNLWQVMASYGTFWQLMAT